MQYAASYCAELVRSTDRDRYIASLFAPAHHREALYALYAFDIEVAQVRDRAREAAAGEIRLQWWREVLAGDRRDEAMASPVAASFLDTIEKHRLPVKTLFSLVEAHRFDLYDEPMQTITELEDYARNTASAVFGMAARVLGVDAAVAARSAGIAYKFAELLAALPRHALRRQLYLPLELLDRHGASIEDLFAGRSSPALNKAGADLRELARSHLDAAAKSLRGLPQQVLPAFLPVATLRRSLDRLDRSDILSPKALAPWRRQWLIWRAAHNANRLAN
jgi:phytoene synthase